MSGTPPRYAPDAGWLLDRYGEPTHFLVARIRGIAIDDHGRVITLTVSPDDCDHRWPWKLWNVLQPSCMNAEAMRALLTVAEGLTGAPKGSLCADSVAAACKAFAYGVSITLPTRLLAIS